MFCGLTGGDRLMSELSFEAWRRERRSVSDPYADSNGCETAVRGVARCDEGRCDSGSVKDRGGIWIASGTFVLSSTRWRMEVCFLGRLLTLLLTLIVPWLGVAAWLRGLTLPVPTAIVAAS